MADLAVNTDSLDMDDLEAEFAVLTSPEPDDEVDLDAMMAEMEADDAAFTLQLHPASRGVTAKSDVADVDEAAPSSEPEVQASPATKPPSSPLDAHGGLELATDTDEAGSISTATSGLMDGLISPPSQADAYSALRRSYDVVRGDRPVRLLLYDTVVVLEPADPAAPPPGPVTLQYQNLLSWLAVDTQLSLEFNDGSDIQLTTDSAATIAEVISGVVQDLASLPGALPAPAGIAAQSDAAEEPPLHPTEYLQALASKQWNKGMIVDIETEDGWERGVALLGPAQSGSADEMRVKFPGGTVEDWEVAEFVAVAPAEAEKHLLRNMARKDPAAQKRAEKAASLGQKREAMAADLAGHVATSALDRVVGSGASGTQSKGSVPPRPGSPRALAAIQAAEQAEEARRIENRLEELRLEEELMEIENAAAEYLAAWLDNSVEAIRGNGLLLHVTAALAADGKAPGEWVAELDAMSSDGFLKEFVSSCMADRGSKLISRGNSWDDASAEFAGDGPRMRPGSPSSVVVFDQPVEFKVLAACTVRKGPEKDDDKIGEYAKGALVLAVQAVLNRQNLTCYQSVTPVGKKDMGGWVKLRTSKDKALLERVRPAVGQFVQTLRVDGAVPEGTLGEVVEVLADGRRKVKFKNFEDFEADCTFLPGELRLYEMEQALPQLDSEGAHATVESRGARAGGGPVDPIDAWRYALQGGGDGRRYTVRESGVPATLSLLPDTLRLEYDSEYTDPTGTMADQYDGPEVREVSFRSIRSWRTDSTELALELSPTARVDGSGSGGSLRMTCENMGALDFIAEDIGAFAARSHAVAKQKEAAAELEEINSENVLLQAQVMRLETDLKMAQDTAIMKCTQLTEAVAAEKAAKAETAALKQSIIAGAADGSIRSAAPVQGAIALHTSRPSQDYSALNEITARALGDAQATITALKEQHAEEVTALEALAERQWAAMAVLEKDLDALKREHARSDLELQEVAGEAASKSAGLEAKVIRLQAQAKGAAVVVETAARRELETEPGVSSSAVGTTAIVRVKQMVAEIVADIEGLLGETGRPALLSAREDGGAAVGGTVTQQAVALIEMKFEAEALVRPAPATTEQASTAPTADGGDVNAEVVRELEANIAQLAAAKGVAEEMEEMNSALAASLEEAEEHIVSLRQSVAAAAAAGAPAAEVVAAPYVPISKEIGTRIAATDTELVKLQVAVEVVSAENRGLQNSKLQAAYNELQAAYSAVESGAMQASARPADLSAAESPPANNGPLMAELDQWERLGASLMSRQRLGPPSSRTGMDEQFAIVKSALTAEMEARNAEKTAAAAATMTKEIETQELETKLKALAVELQIAQAELANEKNRQRRLSTPLAVVDAAVKEAARLEAEVSSLKTVGKLRSDFTDMVVEHELEMAKLEKQIAAQARELASATDKVARAEAARTDAEKAASQLAGDLDHESAKGAGVRSSSAGSDDDGEKPPGSPEGELKQTWSGRERVHQELETPRIGPPQEAAESPRISELENHLPTTASELETFRGKYAEAERLRQLEVAQAYTKAENKAMLADIFGICDTNGSGVLTKNEYQGYLQAIGDWGTPPRIDEKFDAQWIVECTQMGCDHELGVTLEVFETAMYGQYRSDFTTEGSAVLQSHLSGVKEMSRAAIAQIKQDNAEMQHAIKSMLEKNRTQSQAEKDGTDVERVLRFAAEAEAERLEEDWTDAELGRVIELGVFEAVSEAAGEDMARLSRRDRRQQAARHSTELQRLQETLAATRKELGVVLQERGEAEATAAELLQQQLTVQQQLDEHQLGLAAETRVRQTVESTAEELSETIQELREQLAATIEAARAKDVSAAARLAEKEAELAVAMARAEGELGIVSTERNAGLATIESLEQRLADKKAVYVGGLEEEIRALQAKLKLSEQRLDRVSRHTTTLVEKARAEENAERVEERRLLTNRIKSETQDLEHLMMTRVTALQDELRTTVQDLEAKAAAKELALSAQLARLQESGQSAAGVSGSEISRLKALLAAAEQTLLGKVPNLESALNSAERERLAATTAHTTEQAEALRDHATAIAAEKDAKTAALQESSQKISEALQDANASVASHAAEMALNKSEWEDVRKRLEAQLDSTSVQLASLESEHEVEVAEHKKCRLLLADKTKMLVSQEEANKRMGLLLRKAVDEKTTTAFALLEATAVWATTKADLVRERETAVRECEGLITRLKKRNSSAVAELSARNKEESQVSKTEQNGLRARLGQRELAHGKAMEQAEAMARELAHERDMACAELERRNRGYTQERHQLIEQRDGARNQADEAEVTSAVAARQLYDMGTELSTERIEGRREQDALRTEMLESEHRLRSLLVEAKRDGSKWAADATFLESSTNHVQNEAARRIAGAEQRAISAEQRLVKYLGKSSALLRGEGALGSIEDKKSQRESEQGGLWVFVKEDGADWDDRIRSPLPEVKPRERALSAMVLGALEEAEEGTPPDGMALMALQEFDAGSPLKVGGSPQAAEWPQVEQEEAL